MWAGSSDGTPETPERTTTGAIRPAVRFVHLCTGEIVELAAVTSVRVTANAVQALNGVEVVATFPRTAVYFVSDRKMEPPSLN